MCDFDKYVIKIYRDDIFFGYVKTITKSPTSTHFTKTKDVNKALYYISIVDCNIDKTYLEINYHLSMFYAGDYTFEIHKIDIKDIRKSKLKKIKNKQ